MPHFVTYIKDENYFMQLCFNYMGVYVVGCPQFARDSPILCLLSQNYQQHSFSHSKVDNKYNIHPNDRPQ